MTTIKLLRWHSGTSTSFVLELPKRDGTDGLADLSQYVAWTVDILDNHGDVAYSLTDGVEGASIVGALAGTLTVVPGATGRTEMAGLDPHRYDVRADGTTPGGEHHRWSSRLLIDTTLD